MQAAVVELQVRMHIKWTQEIISLLNFVNGTCDVTRHLARAPATDQTRDVKRAADREVACYATSDAHASVHRRLDDDDAVCGTRDVARFSVAHVECCNNKMVGRSELDFP